jgi:hypothetical protein
MKRQDYGRIHTGRRASSSRRGSETGRQGGVAASEEEETCGRKGGRQRRKRAMGPAHLLLVGQALPLFLPLYFISASMNQDKHSIARARTR